MYDMTVQKLIEVLTQIKAEGHAEAIVVIGSEGSNHCLPIGLIDGQDGPNGKSLVVLRHPFATPAKWLEQE